MNQKNNYYPLTRVGEEYEIHYLREHDRKRYQIFKGADMVVIVVCNLTDDVKVVTKTLDAKEEDNKLYRSLKRHKGKIAWDRHFSI